MEMEMEGEMGGGESRDLLCLMIKAAALTRKTFPQPLFFLLPRLACTLVCTQAS